MKKETQEKARKTKAENEVKLFDFMGYEIRKDRLQFITLKNARYRYFNSLLNLFRDIAKFEIDHQVKGGSKVEELVKSLESRDKVFLEGLEKVLKVVAGRTLS